ncbi:MAG: MerR family DNA-binding transcriptional regulator [Patescibacteria group bacterium]
MEKQYITIKEASEMLGVTPLTLRNWDKKGKLVAYRHPLNNYRVYKPEDIHAVLDRLEKSLNVPKKLNITMVEES